MARSFALLGNCTGFASRRPPPVQVLTPVSHFQIQLHQNKLNFGFHDTAACAWRPYPPPSRKKCQATLLLSPDKLAYRVTITEVNTRSCIWILVQWLVLEALIDISTMILCSIGHSSTRMGYFRIWSHLMLRGVGKLVSLIFYIESKLKIVWDLRGGQQCQPWMGADSARHAAMNPTCSKPRLRLHATGYPPPLLWVMWLRKKVCASLYCINILICFLILSF